MFFQVHVTFCCIFICILAYFGPAENDVLSGRDGCVPDLGSGCHVRIVDEAKAYSEYNRKTKRRENHEMNITNYMSYIDLIYSCEQ